MDLTKVPTHGLYMRDPDYLQDFKERRDDERVAPGSYVLLDMVWRRFYSSTTAHGVPHYGYARGKLKKCFWAILVIAALITVLYNLVALSRDYLSYPSDNVIILNHTTSLDFPAVTVCNMNPLKRSAMEARRARSHHRQKRATDMCDPDWTEYNDHCYHLSADHYSWENGRVWCDSQGAVLVKINDQLENDFIDSWVNPTAHIHYWLGLRKEGGTWVWRDGTSPSYVNWDPAVSTSDFCARITSRADWRASTTTPCTGQLRCICEKDIIATTTGLLETTESMMTSQSYLETTMSLTSEKPTTDPSTSIHITDMLPTTQGEVSTSTPTTTESNEVITTTEVVRSTTGETTDLQTSPTTSDTPQRTLESTASTHEVTTTEDMVIVTTAAVVITTEESSTSECMTEMSSAGQTSDTTLNIQVSTTQKLMSTSMTYQSTAVSTNIQTTATTRNVESSTTAANTDQTSRVSNTDITSIPEGYSTTHAGSADAATSTDSSMTTFAHTKSKCCCVCCSSNNEDIGNVNNECHQCMGESVPKATTCALRKVTDIETKFQVPINVDYKLQSDETIHEIIKDTGDVSAISSTPSHISSQSESTVKYSSTTGDPITMVAMESEYPTTADNTVPQSVNNAESYSEINMEATSLLDEPEMSEIGYSLEELVVDCRYSGQTCDFKKFGHFVNNIHGNCYMFNAGWTNTTSRQKSSRTGRRYGLHMVLNVNQKEYPLSGSDTVGVRVVVHSRDRMPFPEDEGVTVSPGRATSISIRQACEHTCHQRHVIQTCGCGDPSLPRTGTAVSNVSVPVCSTSNHTQAICMREIVSQIRNNTINCFCPKPCSSIEYAMGVSIGQWPSRVQKQTILNNLAEKIGDSFSITDPKGYIENLIKMEIFYEEFNFESIRQRPKYQSGGLLSNIGGMLGLWVGFSVFTIIELVEVLVDVALVVPYRRGERYVVPCEE